MSKTTNKFSPEVRERAVRLVLNSEAERGSRWAAIEAIAPKIGCAAQTLNEWIKRGEVDGGRRAGLPGERDPAQGQRVFRPGPEGVAAWLQPCLEALDRRSKP